MLFTYGSMPYLIDTKPYFQRRLRRIMSALAGLGITANQVTLATILVSLLAGVALLSHATEPAWLLVVPAALTVRLVNNHIDGMLATAYGMKTPLGGMLNELSDVVSDACLYLPMALYVGISAPLVVAVVALGIVGEVAGIAARTVGASRRMDGPLSKKPRGVLFSVVAVLVGCGLAAGGWVYWLLWSMVGMAGLTLFNRVVGACVEARNV